MTKLEQIEQAIVSLAGRVGPLLSPVPTAYLVGAASIEYLAWPQPIAIVAALVIECLGLASTGLALELYDYNKRKLASEPKAPALLSGLLVVTYFVVATGLTVALDISPDLARFAPAIFPTLSLTGVSILAIRSDHRARVACNVQAKLDRAEKRAHKRAPKRTPNKGAQNAQHVQVDDVQMDAESAQVGAQNNTLTHINTTRQERKAHQMNALVDALGQNPNAGATELGQLVGAHRNTVYNYLTELADTGRVKKNGNGYKVTE